MPFMTTIKPHETFFIWISKAIVVRILLDDPWYLLNIH